MFKDTIANRICKSLQLKKISRCLKIQLIINGHKTDTQLYKIVQYCAEEINDMA